MSTERAAKQPLHTVEVDQSGKIEQTNTDTVLAFANGISYSIRIPARIKRSAFAYLRGHHPEVQERKMLPLRMFAAGLYLLFRSHLACLGVIRIDVEYVGREADIKALLLRLIWRDLPSFDANRIVFHHVGKGSSAHAVAAEVAKSRRIADEIISLDTLLRAL